MHKVDLIPKYPLSSPESNVHNQLKCSVLWQVTAATSGFIVVFSASMSVVQYWIMGRVPVNWALTAAALSALFSAVGILVVQRILNKYGRASLIVFVVAFVIGISAILMGSLGGLHVWQQFQSGAYMGFHSPC